MDLENLKTRLKSREIYLWGARQLGFSLWQTLDREGFAVTAFLDSSPDLIGRSVSLGAQSRPVLAPAEVLSRPRGNFFILITSGFFYEEISALCRQAGLAAGEDFLTAGELQKLDYQIDVSGACNLKCISCPRGNFRPQPPAGQMSPETFDRVLAKIRREDPFVGAVALYNFGEPLLNRHLPEIIGLARRQRIQTTISSNLSFELDFTEVIKARPTWFRVSASGFGSGYEITHTGGRWDLFQHNLAKLRDLRAEHDPDLNVEVFYHIYKDRREQHRRLKELCDQLGFTLRVRQAALAPLDVVADYASGREISPEARATIALQGLPIGEALERARLQRDRPCPYTRCQWITWDLKVRACMEWFGPGLELMDRDFLETTVDEIIAARRESRLCRDCRELALHRCYLVYGDETLIDQERDLA